MCVGMIVKSTLSPTKMYVNNSIKSTPSENVNIADHITVHLLLIYHFLKILVGTVKVQEIDIAQDVAQIQQHFLKHKTRMHRICNQMLLILHTRSMS